MNIKLKHLPGQHPQARHGWRGNSSNDYYSTLARLRQSGNQNDVDTFLGKWASKGNLPFAAARGRDIGNHGLSDRELDIVVQGYQKFISKFPEAQRSGKNKLLEEFMSVASLNKKDVTETKIDGMHIDEFYSRPIDASKYGVSGWSQAQNYGRGEVQITYPKGNKKLRAALLNSLADNNVLIDKNGRLTILTLGPGTSLPKIEIAAKLIRLFQEKDKYPADFFESWTDILMGPVKLDTPSMALKGGAVLSEISATVKELTYKHLQGQHDQKRHGWRYGSLGAARRSMRGQDIEGRAAYRKRAGMTHVHTPKRAYEKMAQRELNEQKRHLNDAIEASKQAAHLQENINTLVNEQNSIVTKIKYGELVDVSKMSKGQIFIDKDGLPWQARGDGRSNAVSSFTGKAIPHQVSKIKKGYLVSSESMKRISEIFNGVELLAKQRNFLESRALTSHALSREARSLYDTFARMARDAGK